MCRLCRLLSNFNPHSPCGERRRVDGGVDVLPVISIHTPLAGSDDSVSGSLLSSIAFQSTLPLRGATTSSTNTRAMTDYFNPHSPCGERHSIRANAPCSRIFQSTLPLRGATDPPTLDIKPYRFQSTLPLRGATSTSGGSIHSRINFNPHSPCGERQKNKYVVQVQSNFNPHSPCGERRANTQSMAYRSRFQSTLPLRGATESYGHEQFHVLISIHTPLAGSDRRNETFLTK